ncbi:FtsQ-type POTRA domain-containing protein [Streptomyces sp. RB6PN25]|uniref:FtsQ-type POTRA domain-containing protein n=1 Tax=Streptomyces humicola TaxID=2953240 RepID=A0ABT1PV13_9ACTN|nr:FtsQ-type POTRA domain-containing protein [Streptomyces humicola]MCQ4081516.1 FtsQ-type POTRA domain-containing protein [Streptomyces humicola]
MAGPTTVQRGDRGRVRQAEPRDVGRVRRRGPRPPENGPERRTLPRRRAALALLLVIAVAGCGWLLYGSPWLRVRKVEVTGVRVLTQDEVRAAASVKLGVPLVSIDAGAVEARLRLRLPRIASVGVVRSWPGTIALEVTERTPKVALKNGGNFIEVDAQGVRYATDSTAPPGVPQVELTAPTTGAGVSETNRYFGTENLLHAAVQVIADLPQSVQKQTQAIQVESFDGISLELSGGRTVMWGSPQDDAQKAASLLALMKAAGGAKHFDVSAPSDPASSGS